MTKGTMTSAGLLTAIITCALAALVWVIASNPVTPNSPPTTAEVQKDGSVVYTIVRPKPQDTASPTQPPKPATTKSDHPELTHWYIAAHGDCLSADDLVRMGGIGGAFFWSDPDIASTNLQYEGLSVDKQTIAVHQGPHKKMVTISTGPSADPKLDHIHVIYFDDRATCEEVTRTANTR